MSAIYSYQLDRNRPLWMTWVVEGLADGKVAIVMLVHHAYVDGVGASWLMQRFYQPSAFRLKSTVATVIPRSSIAHSGCESRQMR